MCIDALYNSELVPPVISNVLFIELAAATTTVVEFSFNNTTYKQVDIVTMDSPLANIIFAGYHQNELF